MTQTRENVAFVRTADAPLLPAPRNMTGVVGWMRENLFPTPLNALASVLIGGFLLWQIWGVIDWALVRGVFFGEDREACITPPREGVQPGACWAFIGAKFHQFIYGFYPFEERWRVDLLAVVFAGLVAALAIPRIPYKLYTGIAFVFGLPILAEVLLYGGTFGLAAVDTNKWGGLLLTMVVAVSGIVLSLPLGVLLALGRRSEMPIIRYFCIGFIEIWRGVPLITVLFMASIMLPLFLPKGMDTDKVFRIIIGVALFSSAYMAETVRGGLQAIPKGQYEAAKALGLGYWRMTLFIILPQALKIVIPGIVNTFISLLKDTTLVLVVGLFDFLGIIQAGAADQKWVSAETARSGYFVAALVYWAICFSVSRYSIHMERRLATGHKR
jgi:general L-amino acid transport system permease protein